MQQRCWILKVKSENNYKLTFIFFKSDYLLHPLYLRMRLTNNKDHLFSSYQFAAENVAPKMCIQRTDCLAQNICLIISPLRADAPSFILYTWKTWTKKKKWKRVIIFRFYLKDVLPLLQVGKVALLQILLDFFSSYFVLLLFGFLQKLHRKEGGKWHRHINQFCI